ncbi:hemagglutinin repeat-containing protein [Yersinia similis]|uniref:Adhesin/hemagglutinin n=1 Tax=Yersinia similis TaxID=367190 RepID=A0A0T9QS05_9GAMM|nr:hemagglutinin repeat-containing protein [Yersinia similis]CNC54679.1 adhesin/hemagglutinin [Yersinia similis]CNF39186.1 adhesin/hemagglutinin [Yersinia similis]CNI25539.1 adhesin/hemagglutinin [Yersinia similis]
MKKNKFKLSPAGKLTVILSLIITPVTFSYASGIVATTPNDIPGYLVSFSDRENMTPEVQQVPGAATEIKITAPSEQGISHNHYTEFNVNEYGVIFNNATENGTKGGVTYNANQKLNGSPARVILNEVAGINASVLAGHQDIVGMPADYILANANGISCQGCSFSPEFKNVTLAVGEVNNYGGNINISTVSNANILSVSGGKENYYISDDALTLIAPVINSNDELSARSELSLIVGQNKVYLNKDAVPRVEKNNGGVKTIDGYYLGGMASNRIKIVDTRRENNLNLFAGIFTASELDVRTEGTVRIKKIAKNDSLINNLGDVYLKGKNIDISQSLTDVDKKFIGGDAYTAPAIIEGEAVNIEADNNINISGGSIHSKNKTIFKANTINVNAHLFERVISGSDTKKETLIGNKISRLETKKLTAARASMSSAGETSFEAKEKMTLKGVDVKSDKGIKLTSDGDIELNGDTERLTESHDVKYFHYGTDLRTGNDNETKVTEIFSPLIMKSNSDIKIKSSKDTNIHGVNIVAQGQLSIEGDGSAEIGVANMSTSKIKEMDYKQALGIAGSEKDNKDKYLYTAYKSQLTGKGVKINHNKKIGIFGGKINSSDNIDIIAKNGLRVDGVLDKSSYKRDQETGGAFDITISSDEANNKNEGFIDSELTSVGNLHLFSGQDLYIDGGRINAKGDLDIDALGAVTMQAARQQQITDEKKTRLNIEWFAKENSDKQYRAGFLINHQKDTENTLRDEHQIATLSAEQINLTAGDDITFFGTAISTSGGDFTVKTEKNIGFFSAKNRALINKNRVENSGGFYYTGGIDKIGNGVQYTHVDSDSHHDIENNLVVKTHINGNMNIKAGGDITQQGAQHQVAKSYHADATHINNMASHNIEITKTNKLQVDAGIGFNIDYSGFTRPIEKSIKTPANTLDNIGGRGNMPGIADPTAGIDFEASGGNTKSTESNSLALVTTIKSQDIELVAKKDVLDEGTQYHATHGAMKLKAERHFSNAAVNSEKQTPQGEKGEVGGRLGITATKDIKVSLGAKAETSESEISAERMLSANIKAQQGVHIRTTGDTYHYATDINGGTGDIDIKAGKNLYFDQVQDSQRSSNIKISGNGKLSLGKDASGKSFRLAGGGGYEKGQSQRTEAGVSQINTQGNVLLEAGADLTAKGIQIGRPDVHVNNVSLVAAGQVNMPAAVSGSVDINDGALADFRLGGKRSTNSTSKENVVGGGVKVDQVNQSVSDQQGGHIYSKKTVSIKSDSDSNQAIHLQGLKVIAPKVDLSARHGGVFIESALSELPKENWNFGVDLDLVLKSASPKKADGTIDSDKASKSNYKGAGVKVMVDLQDAFRHQNTYINTAHFSLNTKKDAVMKGARIETTQANINVGGDLTIESVKSKVDSVKVDVELSLSHTNDKGSSVTSKLSKLGTKKFEKDIKGKIDSGIKKGELMYNKKSPPKDTMGGVGFSKESGSVYLPPLSAETKSRNFSDATARFMGEQFKGALTNPEGAQGHAKLDVQLVNNDAVAEQSGIFGDSDVVITVQGTTKLHGAEISSGSKDVILKTNKQELSSIKNSYYKNGGGFNVAPTLLGTMKQGINGEFPYVNIPDGTSHDDESIGQVVNKKHTGVGG